MSDLLTEAKMYFTVVYADSGAKLKARIEREIKGAVVTHVESSEVFYQYCVEFRAEPDNVKAYYIASRLKNERHPLQIVASVKNGWRLQRMYER